MFIECLLCARVSTRCWGECEADRVPGLELGIPMHSWHSLVTGAGMDVEGLTWIRGDSNIETEIQGAWELAGGVGMRRKRNR